MSILPFDEASVARAAAALVAGELVAFPTETVYGLGARADRGEAVRRIYEAKGRPSTNPSIVHAATSDAALSLAREVPDVARALAARFWPGPLTIVLRVAPGAVAPEALAGGDTVALRVPAHPAALALLARAGVPVAAPSANRSTRVSPTTAAHVAAGLGDRVAFVLDGGATDVGIESTIVDATGEPLVLLRHGAISREDLETFGPVIDHAARTDDEAARAPAPGGQRLHYAPSTPLVLADEAPLVPLEGDVLLLREGVPAPAHARVVRLPADAAGYARGLYAALHALDALGATRIVVACPPHEPTWRAVHDRLRRAATG